MLRVLLPTELELGGQDGVVAAAAAAGVVCVFVISMCWVGGSCFARHRCLPVCECSLNTTCVGASSNRLGAQGVRRRLTRGRPGGSDKLPASAVTKQFKEPTWVILETIQQNGVIQGLKIIAHLLVLI